MKYLANSFSMNMTDYDGFILFRSRKIDPSEVAVDAVSAIGHVDTARIVSTILGREVPAERKDVHLKEGDILYVAQYKGPRLPEGATQLPEGAQLEFHEIAITSGCGTCSGCNDINCGMISFCHGH